ncbi:MAG: 8-amino-7-oxononanoate synthase [Phycisphaeraceae bacterium]|nr:MAG: 8-amino-7-oxononanoate synthase [Phycisphaeraceae bacterium]
MNPILATDPTTTRTCPAGTTPVVFGGCDYLGLSRHPRVIEAATAAAARYGLSTSASRTTTGDTPEHRGLEADLARFLDAQASVLLLDGLTANIAAMQALAMRVRSAVLDERAHRSLFLAAEAAGLPVRTFAHLDPEDAARVARSASGPVVLATDGVFTADGSRAPVRALLDALPTEHCSLLVDDCHGFMVLGDSGQGTLNHAGLAPAGRVVMTTTLAKGLGCAGGAVIADGELVERTRSQSTYVCTTPTPPPLIAAAREALAVNADEPVRRERMRANARLLDRAINDAGFGPTDESTPIFAFWDRDDARMTALRGALLAAGLDVPLIEYPSGPAPRYFRATATAAHTPDQIAALAAALPADR